MTFPGFLRLTVCVYFVLQEGTGQDITDPQTVRYHLSADYNVTDFFVYCYNA